MDLTIYNLLNIQTVPIEYINENQLAGRWIVHSSLPYQHFAISTLPQLSYNKPLINQD